MVLSQWRLLNQRLTNSWTNLHPFKRKLVLGVAVIVMGLIYLKVISPKWGLHIPCLFNEVTGYYCPGCGVTRASLALIDGDIYQSFRYNMIVYIVLPFMGIGSFLREKRVPYANTLLITLAVIVIVFGVLRNLPIGSFLAPTEVTRVST